MDGDYVSSPYGAPSDSWSSDAWSGIEISFEDDFNSDLGWEVVAGAGTGNWIRAVPSGNDGDRCDNASDADGSGMCYVSGNAYDEDIDDGSTTLTSPNMDGGQGGTLRYARWYNNGYSCDGADPQNDIFVVDISDDGGATWTELETVGPAGGEVSGGWFNVEWDLAAIPGITPSDSIRLRFTASDLGDPSVVEAAVDAISIEQKYCDEVECPGDWNGDGVVNVDDILEAVAGYGTDYDVDDILVTLDNYGAAC